MNGVKLQLSTKEILLLTDPEPILTKNRVLAKLVELLGEVSAEQVAMADARKAHLPDAFFSLPPKISRGEQYQLMPWIMLDYPRKFQEPAWLAIRQFVWWGHLFSSSLLVSGPMQELVLDRADGSNWDDLYVCVHASPWEHDFGDHNMRLLNAISSEELHQLRTKTFLKLAFYLPVGQWQNAAKFYLGCFEKWMQLVDTD